MPETIPSRKSPVLIFSIIGACIAALGIGVYGGMYYQKQTDAVLIADREMAITNLRQALTMQASTTSQSQNAQIPQSATVSSPIVMFALPKKNDRLCRDDMLTFSWKADPSRVDQVVITINTPFPSSPLGDVPVSWNETGALGEGSVDWKIGDATVGTVHMQIPDGELYRIHVEAFQKGKVISKQDSGSFAIDTCKG